MNALGGEFTNLAEYRIELKERIKRADEMLGEIDNKVRSAIGDATYGALQNGGRFSWKANKNGARTLRYNAPKGV